MLKIKCYFISVVIILNTLFSIAVFADDNLYADGDNVLISMDFENYDGSVMSETGFDEIVGNGNFNTIIDEEHGTSYGTTTSSVSRARKDIGLISDGVYYFSFDTYKSNKEGLTYIRFGDQDYKEFAAENLYETFLMNSSVMSFYKGTKGWSIDSSQMSYECNRWYNIGMWLDFNNRTVMYYVDGEPLGKSSMNSGLKGIKCIWVISESKSGSNLVAFDNIYLTKVDFDTAQRLNESGVTVPEYIKNTLEISIDSQEIGHIFSDNQVPKFDVTYKNKSSEKVEFSVEYTVKNSRGEVAWSTEDKIGIDGKESKTTEIIPDVSKYDIYTLDITTKIGEGETSEKSIEFSLINGPSKGTKNYKYGMCMHTNKSGRTSIEYFEFTNEPDYNRQDSMSCAEYATALQYFYRGIKKGNPNATVIAGGTSRANSGWLEGVLKDGGYGYCDAVSCHPYQGQNSPESGKWIDMAGSVKEMLAKNGWDDIDIWVTEANTSSSNQYNTAEGQGWNLVRHYALIDAYNVVDTFISYQFQTNELSKTDNEAWFGTVHGWGVDNVYGAKPAFLFASNYFAMQRVHPLKKYCKKTTHISSGIKKRTGQMCL